MTLTFSLTKLKMTKTQPNNIFPGQKLHFSELMCDFATLLVLVKKKKSESSKRNKLKSGHHDWECR